MSLSRSKPMARGTSQLARTAFKPKPAASGKPGPQQKFMASGKIKFSSYPVGSLVGKTAPAPRAKLKPKKIPPTTEESRWMDAVQELGCVVCLKFHQVRTPAAVHHIVEGSRRLGHFYTIPLCDPGHHQNSPTPQKISRHPNKARFEKKYGSEYELLEYVQTILNWKPI
jgi:hypothetical protein